MVASVVSAIRSWSPSQNTCDCLGALWTKVDQVFSSRFASRLLGLAAVYNAGRIYIITRDSRPENVRSDPLARYSAVDDGLKLIECNRLLDELERSLQKVHKGEDDKSSEFQACRRLLFSVRGVKKEETLLKFIEQRIKHGQHENKDKETLSEEVHALIGSLVSQKALLQAVVLISSRGINPKQELISHLLMLFPDKQLGKEERLDRIRLLTHVFFNTKSEEILKEIWKECEQLPTLSGEFLAGVRCVAEACENLNSKTATQYKKKAESLIIEELAHLRSAKDTDGIVGAHLCLASVYFTFGDYDAGSKVLKKDGYAALPSSVVKEIMKRGVKVAHIPLLLELSMGLTKAFSNDLGSSYWDRDILAGIFCEMCKEVYGSIPSTTDGPEYRELAMIQLEILRGWKTHAIDSNKTSYIENMNKFEARHISPERLETLALKGQTIALLKVLEAYAEDGELLEASSLNLQIDDSRFTSLLTKVLELRNERNGNTQESTGRSMSDQEWKLMLEDLDVLERLIAVCLHKTRSEVIAEKRYLNELDPIFSRILLTLEKADRMDSKVLSRLVTCSRKMELQSTFASQIDKLLNRYVDAEVQTTRNKAAALFLATAAACFFPAARLYIIASTAFASLVWSYRRS